MGRGYGRYGGESVREQAVLDSHQARLELKLGHTVVLDERRARLLARLHLREPREEVVCGLLAVSQGL